jgi:methyl-accepting chemotaxis protein
LKFSIKFKFILVCCILLIIPSTIVGGVGYSLSRQGLHEQMEANLLNSVTMAVELIHTQQELVKTGERSLAEAQELVKETLLGPKQADGTRTINQNMDFGPNGYFYILDENGVLLAHPNSEGKNLWDEQDEHGRYYIREVIQRAQEGGGLTTYKWPLPQNPDRIEEKVVYSVWEPGWGWVVAVGAYTKEMNRYADLLLNVLGMTLGLAILLGALVAYLYASRLSNSIRRLVRQTEAVADGDLSIPDLAVKSRDELGDLTAHVNQMVGHLREMLQQVNGTAVQVAATSEQLLASSEETTQAAEQISVAMTHVVNGSEKQVAQIEQANGVVAEMMDRLANVANDVEQGQQDSLQSVRIAEEGGVMMAKSQQQMNRIGETNRLMNEVIRSLQEKAARIGEVVTLITHIAEQTHLLSLNAAIEAARAGEHGRGFSVVAEEVRKLADQSKTAGDQVVELIAQIQQEVTRTVGAVDENTAAVESGIQLSRQAGESFRAIAEQVTGLKERIHHVGGALETMREGAEKLVTVMEQVWKFAQEATGYSEQVAASSEEQSAAMEQVTSMATALNDTASHLQAMVERFKL